MKKIVLILIFFQNIAFAQSNNLFEYKYNFKGEKLTTAYCKSKGILYKAEEVISFEKSPHWYKNKVNQDYYFSEQLKNKDTTAWIDFYIVDKSLIVDDFYLKNNLKQFTATFGDINYENNFIIKYHSKNKKHNITELFYKINEYQLVRLVITSAIFFDEKYITDKKLFIDFSNFIIDFKERPGKVIKVLENYFEKDYSTQIEMINQIDLEAYTTNSLYGSVLVDLHTNDGSFDKVKNKIGKRRKIDINPNYQLLDIEKFLDKHVNNYDIVMLNEYHSYPHTRFNLMYALKNLKLKQYEYLALETLDPKFVTDSLVIDFKRIEGYYLEEPTCALLVAYANSLGYKLVAYEEDKQCDSLEGINRRNCRDSVQAFNIKRIFDSENNAKLVVLGGHAHIEKKTRDDWKFMRVALQELYPNKKMFSISQTKYIRTNLDSVDINLESPIYYNDDDGQFDGHIISPHYEKYYEWYYKKTDLMNKEIAIDVSKEFYSIEIIPIQNNQEIYYPIFRCRKENLQGNIIYLPDTIEFKIVYKDKNNKSM